MRSGLRGKFLRLQLVSMIGTPEVDNVYCLLQLLDNYLVALHFGKIFDFKSSLFLL